MTGIRVIYPYYSSYLAEALLLAGRTGEALELLDQGIEMSHENLDSFYEPELLRLRAEGLAATDRVEEASGALARALEIARRQGAAGVERRIEQSQRAMT